MSMKGALKCSLPIQTVESIEDIEAVIRNSVKQLRDKEIDGDI